MPEHDNTAASGSSQPQMWPAGELMVSDLLESRSGRTGLVLTVGGLYLMVLGRLPGMLLVSSFGLLAFVWGSPVLAWSLLMAHGSSQLALRRDGE